MNRTYKPNQIVVVQQEGYRHYGEVMSFPIPNAASALADPTIMVRMVPGHPGTLREVPVESLCMADSKPKYTHYAKVKGFGQFPVDMLRYDFAAPLNFTIRKEWTGYRAGDPDPTFGFDCLVVASASRERRTRWTPERWKSFIWRIEEIGTLQICDDATLLIPERA